QVPARVAAAGGCRQGEHAAEEWQELDNAAGHGRPHLPWIPLAHRRNPLLVGQMRYLWLHGFASGPQSSKGRFVRERLAARGVGLEIPDLNEPAFRDLTVSRMLGQIDALLQDEPATPDLALEFVGRMRDRGKNPRLVLLDDGHDLTADLPRLWREIDGSLP